MVFISAIITLITPLFFQSNINTVVKICQVISCIANSLAAGEAGYSHKIFATYPAERPGTVLQPFFLRVLRFRSSSYQEVAAKF